MNKNLEKAMEQISIDEEMGVAQVFGVELAPVMGDPDGEWMVLPDEASSDNYVKANHLFELGQFSDFEEFQDFVNTLISVARGIGEEEEVINKFDHHLSRVVESLENKGTKGAKTIQ